MAGTTKKTETKKTEKTAQPASKSSVDKLRERFDALEQYVRTNHGYNPDA